MNKEYSGSIQSFLRLHDWADKELLSKDSNKDSRLFAKDILKLCKEYDSCHKVIESFGKKLNKLPKEYHYSAE